MQLSDLDKYPYRASVRIYGNPVVMAFESLDSVNLFQHNTDGSLHPLGSIDCTSEKSDPVEAGIRRDAIALMKPDAPHSHNLAQLQSLITQARTLAESLRDAESAATRDNQPGAVGRELSYAIVKLKEAAHWVRDASEIKASNS